MTSFLVFAFRKYGREVSAAPIELWRSSYRDYLCQALAEGLNTRQGLLERLFAGGI